MNSFSRNQYIFIAAVVLSIGVIYFFAPLGTQRDNNGAEKSEGPMAGDHQKEAPAFTLPQYEAEVMAKLTPEENLKLKGHLDKIKTSHANEVLEHYTEVINFYAKKELPEMAAYYIYQKAGLLNAPKNWEQSGDNFITLYSDEQMDQRLKTEVMSMAVKSYNKASDMDTNNLDVKVKLAQCYMEGTGEVMQGVQLLLGIVGNHPNHLGANLMLGKFGIISQQYEKAISRLEKVLSLPPDKKSEGQMIQAHFLLADAYAGSGNKEKAIETLTKVKKLAKDQSLIQQIDGAIGQLRQK
jgi:tetratricopeptide (TPR) repeat protein